MRWLVYVSILFAALICWLVYPAKATTFSDNHKLDTFAFIRDFSIGTRKLEQADHLRINVLNKIRLVIPNKCEKEGEAELLRISQSARIEETYIFIAKACLWVEVGRDETHKSVQLDAKYIKALLERYSSLIFYHLQPKDYSKIGNYFPSYHDFSTLTLINANYIWEPHKKVIHRMITHLGVVQYEFTNELQVKHLMEKYRDSGLRGFEAQNLVYEYMRPKYVNEYYEKIRSCQLQYNSIKHALSSCFPIRTSAFMVTYRENSIND